MLNSWLFEKNPRMLPTFIERFSSRFSTLFIMYIQWYWVLFSYHSINYHRWTFIYHFDVDYTEDSRGDWKHGCYVRLRMYLQTILQCYNYVVKIVLNNTFKVHNIYISHGMKISLNNTLNRILQNVHIITSKIPTKLWTCYGTENSSEIIMEDFKLGNNTLLYFWKNIVSLRL